MAYNFVAKEPILIMTVSEEFVVTVGNTVCEFNSHLSYTGYASQLNILA
jgi:hypothetical protein